MNKRTAFETDPQRSSIHSCLKPIECSLKNREIALHDYHNVFGEARRVLKQYIPRKIEDLRILEIGCGRLFGITLLFHSLGADVIGIDIDFVDPNFSLKELLPVWKENGFGRFAKRFLQRALLDRTYYRALEREFKKDFRRPLKKCNLDVRMMNACSLELPTNHFDYIFSNAVFEHIDDIDGACRELARVLVPGGIACIIVHLFPSLSGGHNSEWRCPDERPGKFVPPWDHLRKNLFPAPVYLNKLREKDYLPVFHQHFTVLHIESRYEGEELLTQEIMEELSHFSREELLKRCITVVMKK